MTLVVPFDGSDLATGALAHAGNARIGLGEDVLAVTVIPRGNATYAVERGWIDDPREFDVDAIVDALRAQVQAVCPGADFEYVLVDRFAPSGTIAGRIRRLACAVDASIVFIGSERAGYASASATTVGGKVALEDDYDVVIVRGDDHFPARRGCENAEDADEAVEE